MKRACLLVLTAAAFLSACSADKPAPSDSLKADLEPAASPVVALPPGEAGSVAVPSTEQAPAPAKRVEPSATASSKRVEPPSSPAPRPAATPKVASAPVLAAPATKPTSQPATPAPEIVAVSSPTLQDPAGKTLYDENCRKCHGVRGVPPKAMAAKFPKIAAFDAAFFAKRSNDSVVTVLTKGNSADMKSFTSKLSHAQMVAVAAYSRSLSK